jgi:hypothetical protein
MFYSDVRQINLGQQTFVLCLHSSLLQKASDPIFKQIFRLHFSLISMLSR